tara:strand:- start:458 stop:1291 length:834 start_codon:yes stop_codon:yes gene_type:complete
MLRALPKQNKSKVTFLDTLRDFVYYRCYKAFNRVHIQPFFNKHPYESLQIQRDIQLKMEFNLDNISDDIFLCLSDKNIKKYQDKIEKHIRFVQKTYLEGQEFAHLELVKQESKVNYIINLRYKLFKSLLNDLQTAYKTYQTFCTHYGRIERPIPYIKDTLKDKYTEHQIRKLVEYIRTNRIYFSLGATLAHRLKKHENDHRITPRFIINDLIEYVSRHKETIESVMDLEPVVGAKPVEDAKPVEHAKPKEDVKPVESDSESESESDSDSDCLIYDDY